MRLVVVVSGPVAGGKSQLARALALRFGGLRLSTREILMRSLAMGQQPTRQTLQELGARLDDETGGSWVADRLSRRIWEAPEPLIIVDAARIAGQVEALRSAFGREVRHVHVTASHATCAERHAERQAREEFQEFVSYDDVVADPTEASVHELADSADVVLDTDRNGPEDVLVRAAAQLGLLDREHGPCVDVIIGGLYGSEGKGISATTSRPSTTC